MSAGVLIVREAGGKVSTLDGKPYSVFSRSVLVSNSQLHGQVLEHTAPRTEKLLSEGVDLSPWYVPKDYGFQEV